MTGPAEGFEFPLSLRWLDRPPLQLATGLAGHVVVLLLWRQGCVHSRDALAEAAQLIDEFPCPAGSTPLAVVGVHVATSPEEGDDARLRRTLQGMRRPVTVAIDRDHVLARRLDAHRLPLLVLLDAAGMIRSRGHGAPNRRRLRAAIDVLRNEAQHAGRAASVPFVPCASRRAQRFGPSGIAIDGERIWVTAAALRRVLEFDRDSSGELRLVQAIGTGVAGCADGGAEEATFVSPAGLLLHDRYVLVVDSACHVMRAIDRRSGHVTTWCGNGRRSEDPTGGAYGTDQGLAAPLALHPYDGSILITQPGLHQIWQFDPQTRSAMAWLGSGERARRDGPEAALCQPTATAVRGDTAWIVEAGSGCLRAVDLSHLRVNTVVQALRRPTAVLGYGDDLLLAASWQPAVLRLRPGASVPEVLFDGVAGLVEPVALALSGDSLWIADAGADALFVADLAATPATLQRLVVELPPLPPVPPSAALAAPVRVAAHCDVVLHVPLTIDPPFELRDGTLCTVHAVDEAAAVLACARHTTVPIIAGGIEVLLPVAAPGEGVLRLLLRADAHRDTGTEEKTWRFVLPIEVVEGGAPSARLQCGRA